MTCLHTYQRYDPTRTQTIRTAFERDMAARFKKLLREIRQTIVTDDAFGLQAYKYTGTPAQKVDAFMYWLNNQIGLGLLEMRMMTRVGGVDNQPWTSFYIQRSYEVGVDRAQKELKKAGIYIDMNARQAMSAPYHADRLALLFTRTYSELKGVTLGMEQQIGRVLAESMAAGESPRVVGRKLAATIKGGGSELGITDTLGRYIPAQRRAAMIARTETIRAHHQATIEEYRHWGAVGVTVKAEWSTAGDDRVCDECAGMEGNEYTLNEIQSMIPVHPNCRCLALPIVPTKPTT